MTALAADSVRIYSATPDPEFNHIPVKAGVVFYEGAAVAVEKSTGMAYIPVGNTAAEDFGGFAVRGVSNVGGANGAVEVQVRRKGEVTLTALAGTPTAAKWGEVVYATTDNDFSMTDSGSDLPIGKLSRFVASTDVKVYFQATDVA